MPDIAMCRDMNCPSRNTCYRFTAKPNIFQPYQNWNRQEDQEKCPAWWDNNEIILDPCDPPFEEGEIQEMTDPSDEFL